MGVCNPAVSMPPIVLDRLLPMHLLLDAGGVITRVGPTLEKLRGDEPLIAQRLDEVFELRRGGGKRWSARLEGLVHSRLRLNFCRPPCTTFKGILMPMPGGGYLLNLSFGIAVIDAVREYRLTSSDFAPTDLAVEMLYLVEANTAVLDESKKLNMRLQGARLAAEQQASTDTLTGLKNRRAMDEALARMSFLNSSFAVMQLDLDFFKAVNDTMGHAAGDKVLQVVAQILTNETRMIDLVARVGGDEFVLIFDQMDDADQLVKIAERIIARLEEPVVFEGKTCSISGSVGLAISSFYDEPDVDKILSDADLALYASKNAGRARVTVYSSKLRANPSPELSDLPELTDATGS
jgi:diguanylate cyclase